jgi:putative transposase
MFKTHCELYNAALEERREAYRKCGKSIKYYDQAIQLKEIRKIRPEFLQYTFSSYQQTLRRLDKAFAAFFRRIKAGEKPGFPRFKSYKRFRSVQFVYGDGISIKNNRTRVFGVGEIKTKWHRPIPDNAKIKQAVIAFNSDQNFYVTYQVEIPNHVIDRPSKKPIGIDLGLNNFIVTSNGFFIDTPQYLRKAERKLRVLQRTVSRRKKGSNRRKKAIQQLAKLHNHIANQRLDFLHKISRHLVDNFGDIAVEALNISGLHKTRMAKSISDAGWGYFIQMLEYKAESAGTQVIKVDPKYTSQMCSGCETIVKKSLSVRTHNCPNCGLVIDRDLNAAINILNKSGLGRSLQALTYPVRESVA